MSLRKKLLDTFGAQVSSDHERYPADVKCLGFLYLYVGRYPRNNASRNNRDLFLRGRSAGARPRNTTCETKYLRGTMTMNRECCGIVRSRLIFGNTSCMQKSSRTPWEAVGLRGFVARKSSARLYRENRG